MEIPYGIIADVLAVIVGGLIGGLLKGKLPKKFTDSLFLVFAFCAMAIGIISTIKLASLTIVIVSILLGCLLGELCHIELGINKLISFTVNKISRGQMEEETNEEDKKKKDEELSMLCLAIAIICFSGTGIFGALSEGLDNDHTILLAKAILDLFTVLIIASKCGFLLILFAIPQAIIFLLCFFLAGAISPVLTSEAIANFKSVGGILTIIIGYNMLASQLNIKKVNVLNLTPAFILVLVLSWVASYLPITI